MVEVSHVSLWTIKYWELTKLRSTSAAYNLKLVIDKGLVDVLKPRWITDSVEAGYALPMTSKYALPS